MSATLTVAVVSFSATCAIFVFETFAFTSSLGVTAGVNIDIGEMIFFAVLTEVEVVALVEEEVEVIILEFGI